ncbi:MAG: NAD(P)-dependent oxidoreductase [Bacteroidales bacterium]|nr:NAD(P)-dependent oxidoreductase [Bacteroidales bacterium]MCF8455987.1 NAD(P)-dependent oxidoreductase [Bacteroidales bacterium]
MANLKVGVLSETKNPPDRRVVLSPSLAAEIEKEFPNVELFIQPSKIRSYKDREYEKRGLKLKEDLSDCDILLGVKEVSIPTLIPGKSYLFFSHTAKKQSYNRPLLQACLDKNITLIDHEYLTDKKGLRLVAFGQWAGVVGAYNGLIAFGKRTGLFDLKRAKDLHDVQEMLAEVKKIKLPAIKILITGGGRVAHGALRTLAPLNLEQVSAEDFLSKEYQEAVVCQIDPDDYVKRKDGANFDLANFFAHPDEYESTFKRYTKVTDFYVACHFWAQKSPVFMTKDDLKEPDFKIRVIADVSCDIDGPIPSTIRPSTIADPFYGYNPKTNTEGNTWDPDNITVMAIDNLPGELPRDASIDFGKGLIERVFPSLFGEDKNGIIQRATITKGGKLTERYSYLQDFVDGKE